MPTVSPSSNVRPSWVLYLLFFCVAGGVGAVISWGFLAESLAVLGIPDPGPLTTAGLPFFRAGAWLLAALTTGSFLASAFLIAPQPAQKLRQARLTVDGSLAARTGALSALSFAAVALLMVPLLLSDASGTPLRQTLHPAMWPTALRTVTAAQAWLWSAVIAAILGVASLGARGWRHQPRWFVLAIVCVIPQGLQGHSAAGGDHDYGTNSLLWHLLFMLLWIGGLIALIAHARRLGPGMATAVRRYSHVALWSVVALAASGLINAAIRVRPQDLLTTGYGRLILAKFVLTCVLAIFGWVHRKATIPALERESGRTQAFRNVAVVEVLVMAATLGVAVSLGRTPPPPPRVIDLSPMALEMGYNLTKAPTFWNVWTTWRFDIMFTTVGLLMTIAYLRGVMRLRSRGVAWPWQRTAWFLLGSVGLALAMSSGVGLYMPAMFSMHMVTHMVLSMVIPVFLVLGAPVTLALEALTPGSEAAPGPREWLEAFLASPVLRWLLHPAVNTIQFITIFYLLYVTPWYNVMVSEHAGHLSMNWVFLLSGCLYYWEMISPDPKPVRNSVLSRLGWLVFSMPFHLYFGVYLMQLSTILAEDFYSHLALPWPVDLMHDQNVGGGIAWGSGAFPLVVVFGSLFMEWLREDRKVEREYDERADETGDDDLDAYNAMLAAMQQRDGGAHYHTQDAHPEDR